MLSAILLQCSTQLQYPISISIGAERRRDAISTETERSGLEDDCITKPSWRPLDYEVQQAILILNVEQVSTDIAGRKQMKNDGEGKDVRSGQTSGIIISRSETEISQLI